jgi:hypothetical protein
MNVKNKYSHDNLGMFEHQRGKGKDITKRSRTKANVKVSKNKKKTVKEGLVHRYAV